MKQIISESEAILHSVDEQYVHVYTGHTEDRRFRLSKQSNLYSTVVAL
jgi:hypothetical protein